MRGPDDWILGKAQRLADAVHDRFGVSCYKLAEQSGYLFTVTTIPLQVLFLRDGILAFGVVVFLVVLALLCGALLVAVARRYERIPQDRVAPAPPSSSFVRSIAVGWLAGYVASDAVMFLMGGIPHASLDIAADASLFAVTAWHYFMACHRRPRRRRKAKVPLFGLVARATHS